VKLSIDNTHGTGFFVAAGLILTCHHVVKNAGDRPIKVRWQNQEDFAVAKVLQSFPDPVDLALLQFETVEALACVELDGAIAAFDARYHSPVASRCHAPRFCGQRVA
jgi:S1-C subfamily serine protease